MAATTTLPVLFSAGTHAARPAANTVGNGALYAESDTKKVYQSDGVSTWTLWLDGSTAVPAATSAGGNVFAYRNFS